MSARGAGLNIVRIESLDDPRVEIFRDQPDAWLRARAEGGTGLAPGLFMAEGELVVRALIESAYEVESVLITPTRLDTMQDILARLPARAPVYLAERAVVAGIVGFDLHRGVLAAGRRGPEAQPEALIAGCRRLLVMEDLANHANVGGLLRSLAALGGPAAGALLSPRCCDPLYRKALRVSMGHALRLPIARLAPWPQGLARLRDAGWRIIALTTDGEPLAPASPPEQDAPPVALLVGAEGPGLSSAALSLASQRRGVPMAPGVDSLNVAVAASIAMWSLWPDPNRA
ncbi:MAG: TrmH family RNA methyltransferase [Phycisphaerales bacterium JB039]